MIGGAYLCFEGAEKVLEKFAKATGDAKYLDWMNAFATLAPPLFASGTGFGLVVKTRPAHDSAITTETPGQWIEKWRRIDPPVAIDQRASPKPHPRIFEWHPLAEGSGTISVWPRAVIIGRPCDIDANDRAARHIVDPDDRSIVVGFETYFARRCQFAVDEIVAQRKTR